MGQRRPWSHRRNGRVHDRPTGGEGDHLVEDVRELQFELFARDVADVRRADYVDRSRGRRMTADAWATAMMVLGPERGAALAQSVGLEVLFAERAPLLRPALSSHQSAIWRTTQ